MADFDIKDWLGGLELSEEHKAVVETALSTEKNQQQIRENFLRQQDYSRRMNELATAKRDAETQYGRQYQELAAWKKEADARLEKEQADKTRAIAEAAALRAAATEYGLDTSSISSTMGAAPGAGAGQLNNPAAQAAVDLSGYDKKFETVTQELSAAPLINAKMSDIATEYEELHGKRFKGMTSFVQEALERSVSLDQLAEEKFSFTAKRAEQEKTRRQTEIDLAVKEAEARVRSELHLPTTRPGGYSSPISAHLASGGAAQTTGGAGALDGVSAAILAFNEGKYRAGE